MTENKRYYLVVNEDNELEYIQDLELYEDIDCSELENLLNEQDKQIKQLEAQLYCEEEEICQICKHKYLLKDDVDRYENKPSYYTAHCRKGHIECSKGNVKHCKDFKLKTGDV